MPMHKVAALSPLRGSKSRAAGSQLREWLRWRAPSRRFARMARPPSSPLWIHEIKHDGYRLIVQRDGKRSSCPNSFPDLRLTKCSLAHARQVVG